MIKPVKYTSMEKIQAHVGRIVMSHDPGDNKQTDHVHKRHGPWCLLEITKGGVAHIRHLETEEERMVRPTLLEIIE